MHHILSSCSVIIHLRINAESVVINVDGSAVALIALVAAVVFAALFFTVCALRR